VDDTLQSILYGQLDIEIKSPSLHEQYEIYGRWWQTLLHTAE